MLGGFTIHPYALGGGTFNHEPMRDRYLLISKQEMKHLKRKVDEKGFTPFMLYKHGGVPKSTISQVLHGTRKNIKITTIYDIISTMGMTMDEFFNDPIFREVSE